MYWVTQKLPQIYTAYHATFPIQIRKITVQICGNFWVTQQTTNTNDRNKIFLFCKVLRTLVTLLVRIKCMQELYQYTVWSVGTIKHQYRSALFIKFTGPLFKEVFLTDERLRKRDKKGLLLEINHFYSGRMHKSLVVERV